MEHGSVAELLNICRSRHHIDRRDQLWHRLWATLRHAVLACRNWHRHGGHWHIPCHLALELFHEDVHDPEAGSVGEILRGLLHNTDLFASLGECSP